MKKTILSAVAAVIVFGSMVSAQEPQTGAPAPAPVNLEKTPWLKGVEISPYPVDISPVIPLKIYAENSEPIPATMTEDVPLTVIAETSVFDEAPPAEYKGQAIPNPRWEENPAISWFFIDWEKNKNHMASVSEPLAANQMVIIPTTPTGKGAITCHIARKMRYDLEEPGRTKSTYANSSGAKDVRVLDITPPLCGLEISIENGPSGACWPVENPPDKYPLPKQADVYLSGALFNAADQDILIPGLELGSNMVVAAEQGSLNVSPKDKLHIKVIGGDNYKLDNAKLKFGLCNGAGGEPAPASPVNEEILDLGKLKLPETPFLYLDATDVAGNRQVMFIPVKIK
ncbi:MAG TPA: hypothetical protein PLM07_03825 [Candidatus Rifleibacterium sp.]|nr:hypothetical protein [Candidatus Rifleibacterium sp.]HPT45013.1 hypothetical protein [Candidatus Rifleibacterium sp.]